MFKIFIVVYSFVSCISYMGIERVYGYINPVVIAFSIDDNYAPFVPVTIESIKDFACPTRIYKIFILGNQISEKHQEAILSIQSKNVQIQIIDIEKVISDTDVELLKTLQHINTATYYRFFIPEILKNYKKVVYLEADEILQDDVAKLFDTDLKDKSLGVIPQDKYSGNMKKEWHHYCQEKLKMKNPRYYFNAGVLVMNIEKLRKNNFRENALKLAKDAHFKFLDQDILNFMFSNDSVYIFETWNVEPFILDITKKKVKPRLIHFSYQYKPWNKSKPNQNSFLYSDIFWKYAEKTPCYDEILKKNKN